MVEEVQIHNEKHSLLTTQSLTSLQVCTIALHVDIHLVCCHMMVSWDKEGTAGRFVIDSLLSEESSTSKGPMFNYKQSLIRNGRDNFQTTYKRVGPIPSIHSFIYTSTHSFSHHLRMYFISYIERNIHICSSFNHLSLTPAYIHSLSALGFRWRGGSAGVNKIVK